jgi:DNA-binding transcriptional ArsR family regulator
VARPKLAPRKLVRQSQAALPPGRAVIPDFDRVIHERLRLGIVSALAVNDSLSFSDLKRLLDTSDGNLSVHARKLEDAHYIVCHKRFEGRVPRTEYQLTAPGRKALKNYLAEMELFIQHSREQEPRR